MSSLATERLSIPTTANGKRQFLPHDQVFPLHVACWSLLRRKKFMSVLSIRIILILKLTFAVCHKDVKINSIAKILENLKWLLSIAVLNRMPVISRKYTNFERWKNLHFSPRLGGIKWKKFASRFRNDQKNFFCFISPNNVAKYEFQLIYQTNWSFGRFSWMIFPRPRLRLKWDVRLTPQKRLSWWIFFSKMDLIKLWSENSCSPVVDARFQLHHQF